MYLISVLTLAFSNQKKINVIHAANLRMHCPTRKENYSKTDHQVNKVIAREVKEANKISAREGIKKVCIAFDLQKVLETLHGENGEFYYRRNFSTYYLTLSVLTSQDTYCCVWDQTVAGRGSNEVASCLKKYLNDHVKGTAIEEVTFICDNKIECKMK